MLIAFAFWRPVARVLRLSPWELHESNIKQTAASEAASVISGGLVAPIPAYLLFTGDSGKGGPASGWAGRAHRRRRPRPSSATGRAGSLSGRCLLWQTVSLPAV